MSNIMNEALIDEALEIAVPLIAKFEGFRADAYRDAVGVWTIGFGHTVGVHPGQHESREEAERQLHDEVRQFMVKLLPMVSVPLTIHQLAALTSFAYNLGLGSFQRSTLRAKLNAGDYEGAAAEFHKWNKAGGRVLAGLTHRREDEEHEFIS